jgi:hypothetical protein
MLKLYTFNISQFSEKARWTLDYEGIADEDAHTQPRRRQALRSARPCNAARWRIAS